MFLAAGHNGQRITSQNGTEWTNLLSGKEGEVFRAVAFGAGRYVAAGSYGGNNIFSSSTDGVKWDSKSVDAKYANYIRGLGFASGMFLALGGDPGSVGDPKPFVMTSKDGVAWSDFIKITGKAILRRFTFGNGVFVGVGDRGRRAWSIDGTNWTDLPDAKALDTLVDVTFGNGVFVGVGLHGLRMASTDGKKWSERIPGEEGEHLNSVVWAEDRFVSVGAGGTYSSPDGLKWKREPNHDAPLTFAYGNKTFVGTQWKGRILVSQDALTWKEVHKCEHHLEAVYFG